MYCFLKMPIKMVKEIKTVMTYHYIPVSMAEINNTDNIKFQQKRCAAGIIRRGWWECKRARAPPPWRRAQWFLTELNIHFPYDPAVLLLDIYLVKFLFTQKTYMNVHSSFVHNSPNSKQPKYRLIGE